ncbi:MAG: hypothetical protein Q7R43_00090 [Candidatus Daviesbacteria bacterium]|nr:hypothetical protein [Candidatus Daviesbacteria bacterium]
MRRVFSVSIITFSIIWIGLSFIDFTSVEHFLKKVPQKIEENLQFSNKSKLHYHRDLLNKRILELKIVAENKDIGSLQTSSQRVSFETGKILEYTQNITLGEKNDIKNQFVSYKPTLEKLRDLFPANSSYWMFIQYDIDTLEIMSKKLD